MITDILIALGAIVILIVIIVGLMIHYQIIENPFNGYRDVAPDYDDDDDDYYDDDDDDDDDDDVSIDDWPVYPSLSPTGFLRGITKVFSRTATTNYPVYDDVDDYEDIDDAPYNLINRVYPQLDDAHLTAETLYGDATEYTVAHVRALMAMEDDVIDFMNNQDAEVDQYIKEMAA